MNLTLNTTVLTFDANDIAIFIGEDTCDVVNFTPTEIECAFPLNQFGTMDFPAGSYAPKVLIRTFGYLPNADSMSNVTKTLQVSDFEPKTSSPEGGNQIVVTGDGFPKPSAK